MYAVGKIGSYISRVTGTLHPFGGAVDIIVVQQPDGSFKSSPWYVRFGKFQGVLKAKEKVVNICVNGVDADFHMYLNQNGEAYFLKEVEVEEDDLVLSSASGNERGGILLDNQRILYSKSSNFDVDNLYPVDQNVLSKEQMLTRSTSQQLPVVSGRNSSKENQNVREVDDSTPRRTDSLERVEYPANLLEAKLSTNLYSDKSTKDNVPSCSDSNMLVSEVYNVIQADEEKSQQLSSLYDGTKNSMDQESCSCTLQEDNQALENFVQKSTLEVSCSITTENNAETSTVGEDNLEQKCEVVSEFVDESMLLFAKDERNSAGVLSGISGSDFQVLHSMELEACSDKQCDEEDRADKVQTILYCESSKALMVRKEDASNKLTQETCISGEECGEVHFHTGFLQARIGPLSKDDTMELIEDNVGLTKEQVDVQKRYAHQENISPFCVSDNVVFEPAAPSSSCTEMEEMNQLLGSVQVTESKSICTISNVSDSGSLVPDNKNIKDESSTIKSEPSSESISECVAAEELTLHSSNSLEEEQFLFSDIDESKISEIQKMELNFSLNVDRENCSSDSQGCIIVSNESVNKSNEPYSLPEMHGHENLLITFENSIRNSRESSKPMDIPRNHIGIGNEVKWLAESMPNVGRCAESFGVHDIVQLSHSLDSNSIKLDGEVQLLSSEVLDIKDASVRTELEIVPANVDLGNSSEKSLPPAGSWSLWPFRFGRSKSEDAMPEAPGNFNTDNASANKICTNQIKTSDPSADSASESRTGTNGNNNSNSFPDNESERKLDTDGNKDKLKPKVVKKLVRIISPTSEQLASLKLKDGRNTVTFTYSTAMLGDQQVDARIYLWKWNTRIVISDVDGTITKSDVLGQFMPLVGVDWSQTGVTHLFSAIKENGYQLLFLSARAISQAYITRKFLFNLKQDGKALPDGPMVISPDGLFPSLFREVIRRVPHEFKIACLEEIRSLFPPDCSPFYAGFGNRDTDEFSYLKVGIPKGKIFIINPKGEVAVNRCHNTRSYTSLHALVHSMFPSTPVSEQEDFNSWNFWKIPPSDINF